MHFLIDYIDNLGNNKIIIYPNYLELIKLLFKYNYTNYYDYIDDNLHIFIKFFIN